MLFNSYIFILLFFPIAVIGYFLINRTGKYKLADIFLIGMSLWFYGYFNPSYLWVITTSILLNYLLSKFMDELEEGALKKLVLAIGIMGNAVSIFYFKYYDFFIDNINRAFGSSFALKHVVLPLGISFFTFQQMSYLADSYKGDTRDYGFVEYALFVVFFPQLIAGPIVLHNETIPQFRIEENRYFNYDNAARGLYVFAVGLAKKVLIADTFSQAVGWGYGNIEAMTSMDALIVSVCYTLQMYFDFSGYCDMASGIGYMFNITLPQNFNSPYKATSIVDHWNRWHMSLTRFLRQYVYFPLGGSKKGKFRTYLNIMAVFTVSGIWHGANWTYIVWGMMHGLLNCLNRAGQKLWDKIHPWIQWLITFFCVDILFIVFRSNSLSQAWQIIKKIFVFTDPSITRGLVITFKLQEFITLEKIEFVAKVLGHLPYTWMFGFILMAFVIILRGKNMFETEFTASKKQMLITVVLLTWGILSLSGVSEFLYFDF